MKIAIVIPAHNEAAFLGSTLESLCNQTKLPSKLVVVNDSSTDDTQKIIETYSKRFPFILGVHTESGTEHAPGSKVINAFYQGFHELEEGFDIICKFDADLIFPPNYLELIQQEFAKNSKSGIVGGICVIEENNQWIPESLTNLDHIRGALKAYRKECFKEIGGLKKAMGWDTIDELLAQHLSLIHI